MPAIKKYSGSGPDAFPNKPGAARELTNPALEFIKSLCHVLSLDPTVTDEVRLMLCVRASSAERGGWLDLGGGNAAELKSPTDVAFVPPLSLGVESFFVRRQR